MNWMGTGALVLSAQALCAGMAIGAESDRFSEERARQQAIFDAKGDRRPEGYVIDRTLINYADTFPPDFNTNLSRLGPNERWLDIGAGRGQAVLDYADPDREVDFLKGRLRQSDKAQAVATDSIFP